ncbi:hypothetical protein FACS189487_08530 [Campylobacterota bacterium]|nr:hypothetical protein FACS189487_08530 [Campylobacterota bacterium]
MRLTNVLLGLAIAASASFAAEYKIAPERGNLTFTIEHRLLGTVPGSFGSFGGEAVTDGDKIVSLSGTIAVASISTDNAKRDAHLKNADFFDEPKHNVIVFKSSESKEGEITGHLVMHGVVKPVTFSVKRGKVSGSAQDAYTLEGVVKRSDFNLGDTTSNNIQIADEVKVKFVFR